MFAALGVELLRAPFLRSGHVAEGSLHVQCAPASGSKSADNGDYVISGMFISGCNLSVCCAVFFAFLSILTLYSCSQSF